LLRLLCRNIIGISFCVDELSHGAVVHLGDGLIVSIREQSGRLAFFERICNIPPIIGRELG